MDKLYDFGMRHGRKVLLLAAAIIHIIVLLLVSVRLSPTDVAARESAEVFKMVDVEEFIPPPKPAAPVPPKETLNVATQAPVAAEVVETEKTVVETDTPASAEERIEFLPQHKVSRVPVIPSQQVLDRIRYPELAAKQGIEAVVYLELHIDGAGRIRNIIVLKDPGYGFAQAAVAALEGIVCQPAAANGQTVAVKFRYPVRFTLKR